MIDRFIRYNVAPGSCMPASSSLLLTGRCNLKCGMCNFWRTPSTNGVIGSDVWIDVLEQLKEMGVKSISLQGGEPTLHPSIKEIACKADALHFSDRQIITNGTRPEVLEQLLPYLTIITFSLDSINGAVHDSIRGVEGIGDRVRETMLAFNGKIPVRWAMVVQEKNYQELSQALTFAEKHGIREMILSFVAGDTVGDTAYADEQLYRNLKSIDASFLQHIYHKGLPRIQPALYDAVLALRRYRTSFAHRCDEPGTTLIIMPDGAVHICCGNLPPIGNIKDEPLKKMWARPETKELLLTAHKGTLTTCRKCLHTRTYFNPRAVVYNILHAPRMAFVDYFQYRLFKQKR